MRSLLDALQEGRLVELREENKEKALEHLALLIEAIPDIGNKTDLVKAVMDRENQFNTGIGKAVAVPHCRTSSNGELLCAVGWSAHGIEYGSPDQKKVHLIVMYYVPDVQRNLYLKEISLLAKVLSQSNTIEELSTLDSLQTVREKLLDWLGLAISEAVPSAKARMIKLDAKQAIAEHQDQSDGKLEIGVTNFHPFKIVQADDQCFVFSAFAALVDEFRDLSEMKSNFRTGAHFDSKSYKVAILSETVYAQGRKIWDAVAYRI